MSTAFKTRTRGFFAMILALAMVFSFTSATAFAADASENETTSFAAAVDVSESEAMPELAIMPTSASVAEGGDWAGKYSDGNSIGPVYLVDNNHYRLVAGFTGLNGATGSVQVKIYAIGHGGAWSALNVTVPVDGRAHAYEFTANTTAYFLIEVTNKTTGDFIYSIMVFKATS